MALRATVFFFLPFFTPLGLQETFSFPKASTMPLKIQAGWALQPILRCYPFLPSSIIPASIERSTYVLLASLSLLLLFWQWNAFTGIVWSVENTLVRLLLTSLFITGWVIVLLSTFMINHFDLFGLKQVFYYFKNKPADHIHFKTSWLYRIVRHPIMLGFLIAFWATPVMTAGHLLFSVVTTAYILVAIYFLEEKDLQQSIGKAYTTYQQNVPMLIPFTKRRKSN